MGLFDPLEKIDNRRAMTLKSAWPQYSIKKQNFEAHPFEIKVAMAMLQV